MNTHKVYTREQLESYDSDQLDSIYYTRVGYRPIKEDGISRNECTALILDYQSIEADERHNAGIKQPAPVSAHTPGPWYSEGKDVRRSVNTMRICTVSDIAEYEANARLISLAPETAKERDELKEKLRSLDATTRVNYQRLKAINTEMLEVLQMAFDRIISWEKGYGDFSRYKVSDHYKQIDSLLSRARQ